MRMSGHDYLEMIEKVDMDDMDYYPCSGCGYQGCSRKSVVGGLCAKCRRERAGWEWAKEIRRTDSREEGISGWVVGVVLLFMLVLLVF